MQYDKGKHCTFYHRYHLVWIAKYRFKVLAGDHVHMFVSIPPSLSASDLMRKMKGRSSHKVQREFPQLKKRYWGRHFWGRGYFSTTNGAITEDVVLQYLEKHSDKSTDASR